MANLEPDFFDTITEEQKARLKAVFRLRKIANEYPDLFARVAEQFMKSRKTNGEKHVETDSNLSPTEAILDWIDQHGEGTSRDIVTALAGKLASRAPKTIVYSMLASLEKRGVLKSHLNDRNKKIYSRA
jgi:hypothetical protein